MFKNMFYDLSKIESDNLRNAIAGYHRAMNYIRQGNFIQAREIGKEADMWFEEYLKEIKAPKPVEVKAETDG